MMASPSKQLAATPRQAARRRAALDTLLDTVLFKALADGNRARILACLVKCGRPCSVTEVAECTSVDFSVVARHLAHLARAGVLESCKEGRTVWYRARGAELSARLRALAEAVDEWSPAGGDEAGAPPRGAGCCDGC